MKCPDCPETFLDEDPDSIVRWLTHRILMHGEDLSKKNLPEGFKLFLDKQEVVIQK